MRDLTAILIPEGQVPESAIEKLALSRGYGDLYLRIAPLPSIKLVQIEVCDAAEGRPTVDPELVSQLSAGGKAAFVHVNNYVGQALVHPFANCVPQDSYVGAPGEPFEAALKQALGFSLEEIVKADDGSYRGVGITGSHTRVFVQGAAPRPVPPGFPTGLDSFRFHDRGGGLPDNRERLALFGYDRREAGAVLSQPGKAIVEWLLQRPGAAGPLAGVLPEVLAELDALGDQAPKDARCSSRVLEVIALSCGRVFATGEAVRFWDERVLPLLSLSAAPPQISADDVEDLEAAESLWHAIVEVLPFSAPPNGEGALLAQLGDEEIGPLSPWAQPGEDYQGAIFVINPTRLLDQMRQISREGLEELERSFLMAWHAAAGKPGELQAWAEAKLAHGEADQARVLGTLAELRTVLELAAGYELQPALLFYEAQG